MEDDSRRLSGGQFLWATLAAVLFVALASVLVVPWFGWPTVSDSDGAFALASLIAAALVGWLSWVGVERYCRGRPILGGAAAGLFTGVFAHPVAWFLWPLLHLTERTGGAAFLMPLASVWSLLFVGWITVPLAIVAGVATGVIRVAVNRLSARRDSGRDGSDEPSVNSP
ncbi:hypothetical protein ACFQMA_22340 [Halosimplex aquaticum]|uniref:Uncharacterized protein n=1 Tax=Halosimplex aquaticum TaxID=3026162 RepID=A0ABD5YAL4_9EURY|nr:hypothetical protein [Halosimplex aquaticum]